MAESRAVRQLYSHLCSSYIIIKWILCHLSITVHLHSLPLCSLSSFHSTCVQHLCPQKQPSVSGNSWEAGRTRLDKLPSPGWLTPEIYWTKKKFASQLHGKESAVFVLVHWYDKKNPKHIHSRLLRLHFTKLNTNRFGALKMWGDLHQTASDSAWINTYNEMESIFVPWEITFYVNRQLPLSLSSSPALSHHSTGVGDGRLSCPHTASCSDDLPLSCTRTQTPPADWLE